MTPRRTLLVFVAVIGLYAAGCATATVKPAAAASTPAADHWMRTELYMAAVDVEMWREFLANRVTPKFPGGFTVLDGSGQWRSANGEIRVLPNRVLVVLHAPTPEADAAIEAIRQEFKTQFNQEPVLRVTAPAQVAF